MKLLLTSIAQRPGTGPAQALLADYTKRLAAYTPSESQLFRTEQAFLDSLARHRARTSPWLVLLDSRGAQLSSESLAARIRSQQEAGRQLAIFAILAGHPYHSGHAIG
jgi:23S rRNA pseudoU1915 N3-methylase RlmH